MSKLRIALSSGLALAACATTQEAAPRENIVTPQRTPSRETKPPTGEIDPLCRRTLDKLKAALDNAETACAEDNGLRGPRAIELEAACEEDARGPELEARQMANRLKRTTRYCEGMERAEDLRQKQILEAPVQSHNPDEIRQLPAEEPAVSAACKATLAAIDRALARPATRCIENNSQDGSRWATLQYDCLPFFTTREVGATKTRLVMAHTYCAQTNARYPHKGQR